MPRLCCLWTTVRRCADTFGLSLSLIQNGGFAIELVMAGSKWLACVARLSSYQGAVLIAHR